jgi:hypothetical protein
VIYIEEKSNICSDIMILSDDNYDGRYDYSFYYIWCRGDFQRQYSLTDNYGINSIKDFYTAHLISGTYEGPDFLYIIKERLSDKAVAKLYYNSALKKLIIDPIPESYGNNNYNYNKLDEYFNYLNQNGIITLTKKSDFQVYKIFVSDLSGKTIFSSDVDQFSYYIDITKNTNGEYILYIITPQNYLMKKVILLK